MIEASIKLNGFESFLKQYYQSPEFTSQSDDKKILFESMNYSLFSGGKRFRPMLSLATAEIFNLYAQRVYPYAASIESIHTYSLIHDDLPCMDNDDYRRGKATNHKVFDEDIALLAGDAFISEAFAIIAKYYSHNSHIGLKLVKLLAKCIGPEGMVAGQVLDLRSKNTGADTMTKIHLLKTGKLIKASVVGVGIIAGASVEQIKVLSDFSENLGLAFQLADDIHDSMESESCAMNEANMINVLGLKKVEILLKEKSDLCFSLLSEFNGRATNLKKLVKYNLNRKI